MTNQTTPPTFYIREVPIYGDTILAPMDGYSDWPFRSLCRELGSAMSYTEFVQVEKILSKSKQPAKKLHFEEVERPVTFQLYGDNPDKIIEAALLPSDVHEATELFVSNALTGIRPVCRLDSNTWTVGPVTRRLQARLVAAGVGECAGSS